MSEYKGHRLTRAEAQEWLRNTLHGETLRAGTGPYSIERSYGDTIRMSRAFAELLLEPEVQKDVQFKDGA